MKARLSGLLLGAAVVNCPVAAATTNFDDQTPSNPPIGWIAGITGNGAAKWTIERDPTAPSPPNVLKQSGTGTYPVCLKSEARLHDGFVEVKFKPIAGEEDRAGGVVWRAKDKDNYFVARANALEDNVDIFHTVNGRRVQFGGTSVKVRSGVWHTLRVEFEGPNFAVFFDGTNVLSAKDATFTDAGMVGVWTKADSVTLFDDFTYGDKAP